jgi:hypothetical protein
MTLYPASAAAFTKGRAETAAMRMVLIRLYFDD